MYYNCKVIILMLGKNDGDEVFCVAQDGGFILCTFFAMAGLKCTQLCSSDFTKTLCLAYY